MFRTFAGRNAVALTAVVVCAGPVHAADEILVTGSRSELELGRLGNAATVISRQEIERRQTRYVTDLLRSVPGFAISRSGVEGTQTQIRVRGSEANHVLVLIDGIRANDPATGDEFRWEQLTTSNIERIEIVRGPQSAIWGTDALAGVVNIITRTAGRTAGVDGYVEAGSNRSSGGGISARVRRDSWSISAGAERVKTDGENISRDGNELDGSDTTTGSLAAGYDNGKGQSLKFRLRVVDAFVQTDAFTTQPVDANEATDSQTLNARLSGRTALQNDNIALTGTVAWFDSDNRFFSAGANSNATRSDRLTLAVQADISRGDDMLSLVIEREQTDFQQRGPVSMFGDPNQDQDTDINSFVADYQGLSGDLSWLVSLRYDDNSDFDSALSGRLSLAWELGAATKLRAGIGTGRKNPSFIERFGYTPDQFLGNPDLKPEKSLSYEAGIDRSFAAGKLQTELTVFHQDLRDEIDGFFFDGGSGMFTAVNRSGKSRRNGLELASTWTPNRRFAAGVSYTLLSSKQKDGAGIAIREYRTPRHSGGVWANLSSAADRLRLTLTADYGGSRNDQHFIAFPALIEKLNHYWLVGFTAEARLSGNLSVFVRGTNVFDEDYEEVFAYNTPGSQLYGGWRVKFGD